MKTLKVLLIVICLVITGCNTSIKNEPVKEVIYPTPIIYSSSPIIQSSIIPSILPTLKPTLKPKGWQKIISMPTARFGIGVGVIDDEIWVAGGGRSINGGTSLALGKDNSIDVQKQLLTFESMNIRHI